MIYIDINKPTGVAVTLNEKAVSINPYFVWTIRDDDTNKQYVFTADDWSPAPWYYNIFTFSVITGATYGATQGIIPAPQGNYIYRVYETPIKYDLNLSNTTKQVEVGIFNIIGTVSVINTFTASNNDTVITFKKL
jgi:hypothetical protein